MSARRGKAVTVSVPSEFRTAVAYHLNRVAREFEAHVEDSDGAGASTKEAWAKNGAEFRRLAREIDNG